MSYKTKHEKLLHYAATAILGLTLSSCGGNNENNNSEQKENEQGLLSKKKIRTADKYSTPVTLQSVHIPLYNSKGQRLENYSILTKGQDTSLFLQYNYGKTSLQRAYINDSPEVVYIMTGEHFEVIDEAGHFIGVVIDKGGKPEIIAPENMQKYIAEFEHDDEENSKAFYSFRRIAHKDTIEFQAPQELPDSVLADSTMISTSLDINTESDSLKHKNYTDSMSVKTYE